MEKLLGIVLVITYTFGCGSSSAVSTTNSDPANSPTPVPAAKAQQPSEDVMIPWEEVIGETVYRWNGEDLYVRKAGYREIPLFSQAARDYHSSLQSEGRRCLVTSYFTPVAVVGDLVSYEHESGIICGTVSGEWSFATIDVTNPKRTPDLREFFTSEQLLHSFLANPEVSSDIQRAVDAGKLDSRPDALEKLTAFLTSYDWEKFNGNSYFEPDYLTRFALHHVEGELVCIRVSTTSMSTAGRANHEYVELYFPISEKLRGLLQKADARSDGFLMKDAGSKVGTKPAVFESRF